MITSRPPNAKRKLRWYQFSLRSIFILTFLVAIVSSMIAVNMRIEAEREKNERKRIETPISRSEWPEILLEFWKDATTRRVNIADPQVFCLSHDEYYWQFESSPELIAEMTSHWKLIPVNNNHSMVRRFSEGMPLKLSPSSECSDAEYFMSADWLAGEKGHQFLIMNDKTHKQLIVRYYFNF